MTGMEKPLFLSAQAAEAVSDGVWTNCRDSAPGAAILDGLHIPGSSVDGAEDEIAAWIEGLDLS